MILTARFDGLLVGVRLWIEAAIWRTLDGDAIRDLGAELLARCNAASG